MSKSLVLYSYFRSSCSYRVRIALYLKNLPFEYKTISLIKEGGEQYKKEFQKLNPLSQVPYLIHGDKALSQSMAILYYLDTLSEKPSLFPKEPFERSQIISFCEIINSFTQPLQNLKVLSQIETFGQDKNKWACDWITRGLLALEQMAQKTAGIYCFGNEITVADTFLIPQMYNARRFKVDESQIPLLKKIDSECLNLESFKKAHPENQPDSH